MEALLEALFEALLLGLLLIAMILVIGGGLGLLVVALKRRLPDRAIRAIRLAADPSAGLEAFKSWLKGDTWTLDGPFEGRSALVGQSAVVFRSFVQREGTGSQGKVSYESEIWSAVSDAPAQCLPKGVSCRVIRREGLVLQVEPG